ncbi:MAG: cyanophycinase [Halieaceae bacterium]|nr:cyanophycinase [Halieaceae bacterium]
MPIIIDTSGSGKQPKADAPKGTLALIGGRFEPDNSPLFAALRQRCNGRIAILSMASGYPEEVGAETVEDFRAQGFYAELVPIFFETREQSAFDANYVERIKAFGSVFFTGGDQSRIVNTLIQNGEETPALLAIRAVYRDGGLIAGSSAGAAIMSGPMILGGTSLHAITRGIDTTPEAVEDFDAFRLGKGLGFFQWGMVDQHFLARGRIGRLICAAHEKKQNLAFGIDENSALLVHDGYGEVVGETGVLMIDLRKARFKDRGEDRLIENVRVSYLDDGDAVDLKTGQARPAADKKRVRVGRNAYRAQAPVKRNAFAGYGLHDLMLRLVESDPAHYQSDNALAYDPATETLVTLEIARKPRKSRALRAVRAGEIRYSAINFVLDVHRQRGASSPLADINQIRQPQPAPDASLTLLGNSPHTWSETARKALVAGLTEPVGIIPTASGEPKAMAERYSRWFEREGIACETLPITLSNIERASRDRVLLKKMESMGSLLLTGGDQRRLTEALLHCAEATPVLHHLVTAYERGLPIVAVAGAASALGNQMIAEGDSVAALRYGSSEDASGSGGIVERGIGLTDIGLIDQHFTQRHRLGRLLMACVEQKQRMGFGIGEGSGLKLYGNGDLEAIGDAGVVMVTLDFARVTLAPGNPDPSGIRIHLLTPGQRLPISDIASTHQHCVDGRRLLNEAIDSLEKDFREASAAGAARFDIKDWQATISA